MTNRTQQEIMQNWGADNSDTPLVSVRCITYNHEPYIAQALDGFLMQKTDFPFEIIVHDDASTDRTAEIIREYEARFPKIIKPIYETENQYSKHDGSLGRIMDAACKGKYIAFCEGDDYWIDENKLQMQADFLEGNPEYGMCYTDYNTYNQQNGRTKYDLFKSGENKLSGEILISDWIINMGYIAPMSWLMRENIYRTYDSLHSLDGTFVIVAHFLYNSKIKYLPQTTAVYRVLAESASHSKDLNKLRERNVNLYATQLLLIDKYISHDNELLKIRAEEHYYKSNFTLFAALGDYSFLKTAMEKYKFGLKNRLIAAFVKIKVGRKVFAFIYMLCKEIRENGMTSRPSIHKVNRYVKIEKMMYGGGYNLSLSDFTRSPLLEAA